jgi:hypothetical protein
MVWQSRRFRRREESPRVPERIPVRRSWNWWGIVVTVILLALAAFIAYEHWSPDDEDPDAPPPPHHHRRRRDDDDDHDRRHGINPTALGRRYAPYLIDSYAEAWVDAAKVVEDGGSISEAQKTLQERWKETRIRSFSEEVGPAFSYVLPEGTEPNTDRKRSQVAVLYRQFAKGLKASCIHHE